MSKAFDDVMKERERQRKVEGFSLEHDDEHGDGSLATAASLYALPHHLRKVNCFDLVRLLWPWAMRWWKPGPERRRELVKAGALIVAEIERIDRVDERG